MPAARPLWLLGGQSLKLEMAGPAKVGAPGSFERRHAQESYKYWAYGSTATVTAVSIALGSRSGSAGASDDLVTVFHGTTSNRASKITGSAFYDARGFRPGVDSAVYFAEDFATAHHFALEAAASTGAKRATVLKLTMPRSVAGQSGLLYRRPLGQYRGAPQIDIPGGTGHERVLSGRGSIDLFNASMEQGVVGVQRLRIGL
jgi:hypothetical protein